MVHHLGCIYVKNGPSTVGWEDSMPFDQVPVRCRLSGSEYDFASGIGSKGEILAVGSRTGVGCLKKSPEFQRDFTPLKTNLSRERCCLEEDFPFEMVSFQVREYI